MCTHMDSLQESKVDWIDRKHVYPLNHADTPHTHIGFKISLVTYFITKKKKNWGFDCTPVWGRIIKLTLLIL